jgi:hypothetical protein
MFASRLLTRQPLGSFWRGCGGNPPQSAQMRGVREGQPRYRVDWRGYLVPQDDGRSGSPSTALTVLSKSSASRAEPAAKTPILRRRGGRASRILAPFRLVAVRSRGKQATPVSIAR